MSLSEWCFTQQLEGYTEVGQRKKWGEHSRKGNCTCRDPDSLGIWLIRRAQSWSGWNMVAGQGVVRWSRDRGGKLSTLTLPELTLIPPGAMAATARQATPRYPRNKGWLLECKSPRGLKKKDTYFMFAFRLGQTYFSLRKNSSNDNLTYFPVAKELYEHM